MKPSRLSLTALLFATLLTPISPISAESPPSSSKDQITNDSLAIHASLSHPSIPDRTASELYASIKIQGRAASSERRYPLNIALVIDRSGSMQGDAIAHARNAAVALVDQLRDGDHLSLITYSDDVTVLAKATPITPQSRASLKATIKEISADGYTHLSGGFEAGCDLVASSIKKDSINRVLLMSDGQANVGVTDPTALARMASACLERGVSLSTIGLGLDYNEDVMTQMAIAGAGNYHFIHDERAMAAVFTQEASSLASTVARRATLRIELAPGVELLKLHGYKHTIKGNTVTVPLAEFTAQQRKDLLLKLSVSAQAPGTQPILSTSLRYEDTLQARDASASAKLSARVTTHHASIAKEVDRQVISHAQKVEVAQTMQDSMQAYERGDQQRAAAILKEQREAMNKARSTYDFEDDGAYSRVEGELKAMESAVQSAPAASEEGKMLQKAKKKRSYDISNAEANF